jgi:sortase A
MSVPPLDPPTPTDATPTAPADLATDPGPPADAEPTAAEPTGAAPTGQPALHRALQWSGEVLITLGVVVMLFAGYELWGKAIIIQQHQRHLEQQLLDQWGQPTPSAGTGDQAGGQAGSGISGGLEPATGIPADPPPGWAIGRLYVPRLQLHWVVVQGISLHDLAFAPGHYPTTAMPGRVGNFSVAGHRTPAMFWDLDRLRPGDPIVLETRTTFYVYRVTRTEIVAPTAVGVIAPVPDHPGQRPTVAMLTLTTCNPRWDNYQRLVVHAKLVRDAPRSAGTPTELGG